MEIDGKGVMPRGIFRAAGPGRMRKGPGLPRENSVETGAQVGRLPFRIVRMGTVRRGTTGRREFPSRHSRHPHMASGSDGEGRSGKRPGDVKEESAVRYRSPSMAVRVAHRARCPLKNKACSRSRNQSPPNRTSRQPGRSGSVHRDTALPSAHPVLISIEGGVVSGIRPSLRP